MPDIPGIEHVISLNEALDLPSLPRRIVIVGGGYIAVEFAGIFRGFGSEVVEIIRREELLYGFDDDLRVALAQEMRTRGIEIHTRTQSRASRNRRGKATRSSPPTAGKSRLISSCTRPAANQIRAASGSPRLG